MLVSMNEVVKKEGKAIPQFNINNVEFTRYILEECQNQEYPVILGVSGSAIKHMGGPHVVTAIVKSLIQDLKITIPVVIHLDHGQSVELCKEVIDAGFTSVMIDRSKETLEKNIEDTKIVIDYAHSRGVSVEGEIGGIGGSEDGVADSLRFAEVVDCIKYVEETGVDFLAPALGSVHGLYKGKPNLQFDRFAELNNKLNTPLVLHGASGIPEKDVTKAIECGVRKVNIDTELRIGWTTGVRKFLKKDKKTFNPREIIKSGEEGIKEVVRKKIELYKKSN